MVDNTEDLIQSVFEKLTGGLSNVASNSSDVSFEGGPFDDIGSVLDKFGLNFNTSLVDEFKEYYNSFKADILGMDGELQDLINLRPKSLSKYSELLQLGSKVRQFILNIRDYS